MTTALLPLEDAISSVIRQINSYRDTGNEVTISYVRHGIREIQSQYGPMGQGAAYALLVLCRSVQRMNINTKEEDQ